MLTLIAALSSVPMQQFGVGAIRIRAPRQAGIPLTSRWMRVQNGRDVPVVVGLVVNVTEWPGPGPNTANAGVTLTYFTAYEQQPGDLAGTNYTFLIDRNTDVHRRFSIGEKDGVLRTRVPLDREEQDRYLLRIGAQDEGGNTGWATVNVNVDDVNDNPPNLRPVNGCVVPENTPAPFKACTVFAYDLDSPKNGPPFKFKADPNPDFDIQIDTTLDNGNGGFTVTSKHEFDREQQSTFSIPIVVSDSGTPSQTATQYLTVIIGDVNDNPMSDGSKTIQVYSYKGELTGGKIGSVYVTDKDDWDLPDKTFTWKTTKPDYFDLDSSNGDLSIAPQAPTGQYKFDVFVRDTKRNEEATGTVTVNVELLPEEAFIKSGSIRIVGITAEQFIKPPQNNVDSPLDRLKTKLAGYIGVPTKNVQVFSVMPLGGQPPKIDVRFAAYGSPYKSDVLLNGMINLNRDDFEKYVLKDIYGQASIEQVDVNECLIEICADGCTNKKTANAQLTVINANQTALAGVTTNIEGICGCQSSDSPGGCTASTCMNSGFCHPIPGSPASGAPGFFCECRGDNLKGPRCEGMTRTFSGSGYAWVPGTNACKSSHVSFEFLTEQSNALLMYIGPMARADWDDPNRTEKDFFAVGLEDGRLWVQMSLGSAQATTVTMGNAPQLLNQWHAIDILRNGRDVQIVIDRCRNVPGNSPSGVPDYNSCRQVYKLAGDTEFLNVNTPLQLGGVAGDVTNYPNGLKSRNPFKGCMRNLRFDDVLYDLQSVAYAVASDPGCGYLSSDCNSAKSYCQHGECLGDAAFTDQKCICDPGWHGDNCDTKSKWRNFAPQSFINYLFQFPMNKYATDVQFLFVPQKADGTLVRATSTSRSEYLQVGLSNWTPQLQYDFGKNPEQLSLNDTRLQQMNYSYIFSVHKWPGFAEIRLDHLTGSKFSASKLDSNAATTTPAPIDYDPNKIFVGGDSGSTHDDFQGCVADFYWDGHWIPMSKEETVSYASVTSLQNVDDSCQRPTCALLPNGHCKSPFVCVDFWKGPFCTCPDFKKAMLDANGVLTNCGEETGALHLGITTNAVVAILVSVLVLIILVLFLVIWMRRRRPLFQNFPPDDYRDNIMNYSEEGGGEHDHSQYDISRLRKPVLPMDGESPDRRPPLSNGGLHSRKPTENGDVGAIIDARLNDADLDPAAPPYDELRIWADEGDGLSSAGSLSSLESGGDEFDPNELNAWGPRFQRIADLYEQEKRT